MKLTMKTYLIVLHLPKVGVTGDELAWPAHRRVRASTATRAIAQVHRSVREQFNAYTEDELTELGFESAEGIANSFSNRDFPIVEVKVVA
jgi:hypothetical protein